MEESPSPGDMRVNGAVVEVFDGSEWVEHTGYEYVTSIEPEPAGTFELGSSAGSSGDIVITTGTSSGAVLTADSSGELEWKKPIQYAPESNFIEIVDGELVLNGMKLPNVENFKYSIDKIDTESCLVEIKLRARVTTNEPEIKKPGPVSDIDFMKELKSL